MSRGLGTILGKRFHVSSVPYQASMDEDKAFWVSLLGLGVFRVTENKVSFKVSLAKRSYRSVP